MPCFPVRAALAGLLPSAVPTAHASQGTGFIVQFHVFLDDLMQSSLGKPLFSFSGGEDEAITARVCDSAFRHIGLGACLS
jgi:hypothetical protein